MHKYATAIINSANRGAVNVNMEEFKDRTKLLTYDSSIREQNEAKELHLAGIYSHLICYGDVLTTGYSNPWVRNVISVQNNPNSTVIHPDNPNNQSNGVSGMVQKCGRAGRSNVGGGKVTSITNESVPIAKRAIKFATLFSENPANDIMEHTQREYLLIKLSKSLKKHIDRVKQFVQANDHKQNQQEGSGVEKQQDTQQNQQTESGFAQPKDTQQNQQTESGFAQPKDTQQNQQTESGFAQPKDTQQNQQTESGFAQPKDTQQNQQNKKLLAFSDAQEVNSQSFIGNPDKKITFKRKV
jgi:hypothetical protein